MTQYECESEVQMVKLHFVSFSEESKFNKPRKNLLCMLGPSLVLFNNTNSYTPNNVGGIISVGFFLFVWLLIL